MILFSFHDTGHGFSKLIGLIQVVFCVFFLIYFFQFNYLTLGLLEFTVHNLF
jgi:hypothetical protein